MSWLLHPEPLGPTPFGQGRECRRLASGKFLYQVWLHQLLGGVSCSSIVGLNKFHLFQRWRKKMGSIYLENQTKIGLRRARLAWVQSLFPGQWRQLVSPAGNQRQTCPHSWRDKRRGSVPRHPLVTTNTARHLFSWYRVQFLATRP